MSGTILIYGKNKWAYSQRHTQRGDPNLRESCQKGDVTEQAEACRKWWGQKQRLSRSHTGIKSNEEIKARSGGCNVDRWQGKHHHSSLPIFLLHSIREKFLRTESLPHKHNLEKTPSEHRGYGKAGWAGTGSAPLRPDVLCRRAPRTGIGVMSLLWVSLQRKRCQITGNKQISCF